LKHLITIIIITFTVALGCANAQERLLFSGPSESITTDITGNVYRTQGVNLDMLLADGSKLRNYSDPTNGDISSVDAGIASKILVFYRESGTIMLLNNELAPIGASLSLFERSLMTVSLAAMGNPNKIVLYDEANQDLLITDLSLNLLSKTHITFPGEFHPTDMQVVPEHRIALLDTLHGICLFDFFGTFEREIPIPGIKTIQLMKDQIIYLKDKAVYQYILPSESSPMSINSLEIKMPVKAFHLWRDELYVIDDHDVAWKFHR
jgi:hypothetical protein